MGLDRDDSVIRRRLRQKMEFVSEDLSAVPAPGDAELTKFLEAHREKFARPSRVSFEQVYFSPERRGEATPRDAARALEELWSGHKAGSAGTAGVATMLPLTMEDATPRDIASVFGEDFATQLDQAPLQQWLGPLQSSYGLTLRRISEDLSPPIELPIYISFARADESRVREIALWAKYKRRFNLWYQEQIGDLNQIFERTNVEVRSTMEAGGYLIAFVSEWSATRGNLKNEVLKALEISPKNVLLAWLDDPQRNEIPGVSWTLSI